MESQSPRSLRTALLLTAAALLVAAMPSSPSDPPAPQQAPAFGDELEVTVVNVDVYVRDRKGRPVDGLGAGDFRLFQDGVEVPISNFAVFAGGAEAPDGGRGDAGAANPGAAAGDLARPVWIVLFVDNVNIHALNRNRVLNRMRAFVEENLAPPVQMMVVSARPTLAVRQTYTDEPEKVIAALEGVAAESSGRPARDRDRREILEWMHEIASDARMDVAEFLDTTQVAVQKVQVQAQIMAYVEQESDILEDSLITLHEVLRLVSGREGRKAVIHVSNGLPMIPGVDLLHQFEAVFRDNSIYSRIAQREFTADFTALAETANGQGVSLYAIDAGGLNPLEGFRADDRSVPAAMASSVHARNLQETLSFMADATGGLAVLDTNDVTKGLGRLRDDLVSYYSLGYPVALSGEDLAHRIRVELPGHPKLELRYREWFVEKSPLTQVRERVLSALVCDIGDNPMGIGLSVDAASPVGDRQQIALKVSVPLAALSLAADGAELVGAVQLVVGLRDHHGRETPPQGIRRELRIPAAEVDAGAGQRVAIAVPLLVRGRQHTVAVGVTDLGTGQSSFARMALAQP